MSKRQGFVLALCILCVYQVHAQYPVSTADLSDSLLQRKDVSGVPNAINSQGRQQADTRISLRVYFSLLGSDFVQELAGPFHSSKNTWLKAGGFVVVEAGMFSLDRRVQRNTTQMMQGRQGLQGISHVVTGFGSMYEGGTLVALGLYGWARGNEKLKTTTLLATQACIVGGVMETAIKLIAGRQGPYYTDGTHTDPVPAFHGPAFALHHDVSFPSGHTTEAFAAATVFALEYKDHPWVPVLCYTAATMVGITRITENAHWISDVFAGAALGYVTGRTVVNNYHRYAAAQKRNKIVRSASFNLHYNYNHLEPAVILALR